MMDYAERSYAGPDITGRTYQAEPVKHCAAWADARRVARLRQRAREYRR